jgi:ribosome maturation factor RimP
LTSAADSFTFAAERVGPRLFFLWAPSHGGRELYSETFEKSVRDTVQPVLAALGFALVELAVGRRKGSTRVSLVIYRREGVGIDHCATVSSAVLPRLETLPDMQDVSLEVSSPGTERNLRTPAEYEIFSGRGVRILSGDETEWRRGIIEKVDNGTLWLKTGRERHGFALAGIRRGRLDHAVEVEEDKNAV